MGEHIDNRISKKKKLKEHDTNARQARITFKRYLRELEEELLDEPLAVPDESNLDDQDD